MDNNVHMSGLMSRHDDEATRTSTSEGLEEGEVEGETLLIVESEDQASVDLSHDQSGDSLNSDEGDASWMEEMSYYCEKCQKWIPASQLREQLSYLKGDNFFRFTCSDCSEDGKEQFERLRLTWQQVVMLAMYNLSLEGTGRQGYFRWKEDICAFIEKHWTFLLGNRKKTSTWWSTVAGCLSVGSPLFFRSGAQEFGEPGWWKLVHNKPPTMKPEAEKLSASALKAKAASKPPLDPIITVEGLRKRVSRNPVESAMELKEKRSRTQEAKDIRRAQKEAAGFLDRSTSSTPVKFTSRGRRPDMVLEKGEVIDFSSLSSSDRTPLTSPSPSPSLDFSAPGTPASHSATPSLLSEADLIPDVMPPQALFHDDEEMEGDGVIDPGIEYIPPPSGPVGAGPMIVSRKKVKTPEQIKQEVESEEEKAERMEGDSEDPEDSNASLQARGRDKRKPQVEKDSKPKAPKYTSVSIYEEKLLLKRLEACPNAVSMTPEARRLRRKLIVRQAKRERGLPLFDLDQVVNAALLLVDGIYGAKERGISRLPAGHATYRTTSQDFRILDRYQTMLPAMKGYRHQTTKFLYRLVGSEDLVTDHSIVSPYTSRVLKPYIRRDHETKPPKLQLLAEICAHPHKNDPDWKAEPEAPIDYCYVRPNHIPTINSMCHEFFWPGIDLSECLQYPDFSVVVLYKKVIIAFGFMVPDVKYNEAYISFLFVHPEWRRAGIATFMIYHLIQTCMGKDVTLHVSASKLRYAAVSKIWIKTEEYILDFYDKYTP
ncbi:cysteine-rich protein 2-binding protein isoform X1 [Dermochelys coriacea]|uniref:cysteine-rich protein 2-binding protein isoform X1 n=1 Tax=Dermochelys coriacea TaxID=27794 RepID=UPI0018E7563B|nr:cysteine-rich protein 2-binding protein isoform X1 [Dermochelys coriacea]